MHIRIKKGLDIPIEGAGAGPVTSIPPPRQLALDVTPFSEVKFKVLVKIGDPVRLGQPLLHNKKYPEMVFTSPAGGTLKEIRRGLKRRLLALVIEVTNPEEIHPFDAITKPSAKQLAERGLFAHIRMRPFDLLANPTQTPKAIFVRALESAPLIPPPEMQVEGVEVFFQAGLTALAQFAPVHLVGRSEWPFKDVEIHTASGPHPISSPSIHIQKIAPIRSIEEIVWTLNVHGVLCIGHMLKTGRPYTRRIINHCGQFIRVREGTPIADLTKMEAGLRYISGDPLNGREVAIEDFLGFDHFALTSIPEIKTRQFLHFLRLRKYSATRTYLSPHKRIRFTTSLHGEERAFIDGHVYDRVMPMRIPTMPLVKAILTEDWDLAERLGILEIAPEDFVLPTFICPSKIEMVEIVKTGLAACAAELLD